MSQSLIAKIENGRQVPKGTQVVALCDAYGVSGSDRAVLAAIAEDLRAENQRVVLRRNPEPAQKRIGRIQQVSSIQRCFSPSGLPGLLQTADYCRALFGGGPGADLEAAEAASVARLRNQEVLDTDREFQFVLPEGSLGWALLPGEGMARQIEHLLVVAGRPNVQLGIIPWGQPVPELPLNSWTEYDDHLVIVGTMTRVAHLTQRGDLDEYRRLFNDLQGLAVHDGEASDLLRETARRYRVS